MVVGLRAVRFALTVASLFVAGYSYGQIATFTPQNPKIGDVIRVAYFPQARYAVIQRASSATLRALILPEVGSIPTLLEIPLIKSGTGWQAEFTLLKPEARFILYEFVSGDLKDDNRERGWDGMVLGPDGKALKGGHYWRGAVVAFGGYMGFKHATNVSLAKREIIQERSLYPENYYALNLRWYLEMNPVPTDAGKVKIKKELVTALKQFRNSEEALPMILVWLEQVGETERADSLRKVLITENPKGIVAAAARMREISKEQNAAKRSQLLEQYLQEFRLKEDETLSTQRQLVSAYVQAGQYDSAFELLQSVPKLDAAMYKSVTSPLVEKGVNLEKAIEWATFGINIIRNQHESAKPPPSTLAEWKRTQTMTLSSLLNIRGHCLLKLGKAGEAVPSLTEAYDLTEGRDVSVNANLIDAYIADSEFDKAVELGLACIRRGKTNLAIIGQLKTAYTKVYGSLAGYDTAVQAERIAAETELLKGSLKKVAPGFALRDLNGSTLKLSDLRGKVVVLDFWASWSAACKASFSHLQRVAERYKEYRAVAFVLVNTSESAAGAARDSLVKKFIEAGKISFQVVFDKGSSSAQQYDVEGIPARFVLDKEGNIRFKSVGFGDGDAMVNDLTAQIEALLKQ